MDFREIRTFASKRGRSLLRRAGALAVALLMTVGVGVGGAAPASAAKSDCPAAYSCTWKNTGFSTGMTKFEFHIYNFAAWPGYNDTASSVYNHGQSCWVEYFADAGYVNTRPFAGRPGDPGVVEGRVVPLRLAPGQYVSNLHDKTFFKPDSADDNWAWRSWDNRISSGKFWQSPETVEG